MNVQPDSVHYNFHTSQANVSLSISEGHCWAFYAQQMPNTEEHDEWEQHFMIALNRDHAGAARPRWVGPVTEDELNMQSYLYVCRLLDEWDEIKATVLSSLRYEREFFGCQCNFIGDYRTPGKGVVVRRPECLVHSPLLVNEIIPPGYMHTLYNMPRLPARINERDNEMGPKGAVVYSFYDLSVVIDNTMSWKWRYRSWAAVGIFDPIDHFTDYNPDNYAPNPAYFVQGDRTVVCAKCFSKNRSSNFYCYSCQEELIERDLSVSCERCQAQLEEYELNRGSRLCAHCRYMLEDLDSSCGD